MCTQKLLTHLTEILRVLRIMHPEFSLTFSARLWCVLDDYII